VVCAGDNYPVTALGKVIASLGTVLGILVCDTTRRANAAHAAPQVIALPMTLLGHQFQAAISGGVHGRVRCCAC
jgi:hypothetical protein